MLLLLGSVASADSVATTQRLAQATSTQPACTPVISCGTKDGKRKEYPDPCKAREDGATDIRPKTGPTCEASQ